jgi:hypothetical protein
VRIGWPRGKRIAVSGSVTPQAIGQEIARSNGLVSARRTHMLEALEQALARFTTAQYGREAAFDAAALDESLADSAGAVRRLMFEQISPLRRLARRRVRTV